MPPAQAKESRMSRLWGRLHISRSYSNSRPAAYSDATAVALPQESADVDGKLSSAQGAVHGSVPEDVIRLICEYACAPFPQGGRSSYVAQSRESRSEWRQPTLAALMRLNKQFFLVAGEYLYSTIITDDLPALLAGAFTPPSSSFALYPSSRTSPIPRNKLLLLSRCRHLALEPSLDLLRGPQPNMSREASRPLRNAMTVLNDTLRRMYALGGLPYFFPNLEKLSTSAYTGVGWEDEWVPTPATLALIKAWKDLEWTLEAHPNFREKCQFRGRHYPFRGQESREHRTDETRSDYYVAEWDRPGLVERLKLGGGEERVMVTATPTFLASRGPPSIRAKTKPIYYVHHNSSSAPYLPSLSCTIRYLYSPQPCGLFGLKDPMRHMFSILCDTQSFTTLLGHVCAKRDRKIDPKSWLDRYTRRPALVDFMAVHGRDPKATDGRRAGLGDAGGTEGKGDGVSLDIEIYTLVRHMRIAATAGFLSWMHADDVLAAHGSYREWDENALQGIFAESTRDLMQNVAIAYEQSIERNALVALHTGARGLKHRWSIIVTDRELHCGVCGGHSGLGLATGTIESAVWGWEDRRARVIVKRSMLWDPVLGTATVGPAEYGPSAV